MFKAVMHFLSKKECPDLLAYLGEKCWYSTKTSGTQRPFCSVTWVDERIITIQNIGEHMLLRVSAVLSPRDEEQVENLMENISLKESGCFHYSVKWIKDYLLAEVECYEAVDIKDFEKPIKILYERLNHALVGSDNLY